MPRQDRAGQGRADWPDYPPHPSLSASTRLAMLSSSLTHWKKLPPLPSLTSQPHQVLASEPIPFSDLQQVSHPSLCPYRPTTVQYVAKGSPSLPPRRSGSGVTLVIFGPSHSHLTFFLSLLPFHPLNLYSFSPLCSFLLSFPSLPFSLCLSVSHHSLFSGYPFFLPWFLVLASYLCPFSSPPRSLYLRSPG